MQSDSKNLQEVQERKIRFTSNYSSGDLLSKIEGIVKEMGFRVAKRNGGKLRVIQAHNKEKSLGSLSFLTEVIQALIVGFSGCARHNSVLSGCVRHNTVKPLRTSRRHHHHLCPLWVSPPPPPSAFAAATAVVVPRACFRIDAPRRLFADLHHPSLVSRTARPSLLSSSSIASRSSRPRQPSLTRLHSMLLLPLHTLIRHCRCSSSRLRHSPSAVVVASVIAFEPPMPFASAALLQPARIETDRRCIHCTSLAAAADALDTDPPHCTTTLCFRCCFRSACSSIPSCSALVTIRPCLRFIQSVDFWLCEPQQSGLISRPCIPYFLLPSLLGLHLSVRSLCSVEQWCASASASSTSSCVKAS
ncbi:hypothetical protein Scep_030911 [Stephania cephalantha]|uniref:Uncharacterized protein n=1 Tax=Stephania cephalantha TaxID=152367 RepID=A0AAP0E3C2_9MAGN